MSDAPNTYYGGLAVFGNGMVIGMMRSDLTMTMISTINAWVPTDEESNQMTNLRISYVW